MSAAGWYWGKELLTQQLTGSSTQTQPCDNAMSMVLNKGMIAILSIYWCGEEDCQPVRGGDQQG